VSNILISLVTWRLRCTPFFLLFSLRPYDIFWLIRAPVVLRMWPCKKISHIQVEFFFPFLILPIKPKLGLQIGGRLLIATHLDQTICLTNQNQGAAVRSYLLNSFLAGVSLCCAFYRPQQTLMKCRAKTILLRQTSKL
jgi:hypothetical protein